MTKSALIPLAEGFEEIEAITIIDVLRRAGIEVLIASVGGPDVVGGHGIRISADASIADCADRNFDVVVLPGGARGAENLASSGELEGIVRKQRTSGGMIGAICAAPALVLKPFDALPDGKAACYPTFRDQLDETSRTDSRVAFVDGVVTGAGPGAALEFSLELVKRLVSTEKAEELARGMLADLP